MNALLVRLIIGTLLVLPVARGATITDVALPERHGDLKLQGAGLLRKGFIFKIYVGALYLQDSNHVERILDAVPKRLDIHYFRHTPGKMMIRVANETLKKNLTESEYLDLRPKIDKLHDAFRNGKKGSYASLVYSPGEGLTYLFDGQHIITIACDDFANAYFSIWLGDLPSSKTMKEALLGKTEDRDR